MITTTKANNCFLGCCYPLTQEDFFDSFDNKKDFVHAQLKPYKQYTQEWMWENVYKDFAEKMTKELLLIEKAGACVKKKFCITQLKETFGFSVFSLFTHHNKSTGEIEFFDGMYSKEKFKEQLPDNFDGIIDLTACNSNLIRNEVKKRFGNQVIAFDVKIGILGLALVYKQVLINLNRYTINYVDCYTQTIQDLFKK